MESLAFGGGTGLLRNHVGTIVAMVAIGLIVLTSGRVPERIGDKLQVGLPVAALGCAIAGGDGLRFFGRYLLLEAGIKIPKFALGDTAINQRPNGNLQGFPSGHTAASTFGATALAATCMNQSKLGQGTVLMAAAFTGSSRIESEKHNIWQVLAGAVWGWFAQAAALTWFDRKMRRVFESIGRLFGRLKKAISDR